MLTFQFFAVIDSVHIKKLKKTKKDDGSDSGPSGGEVALKGGEIAANCMKALSDNIPPSFCWKEGGDIGVIPTRCPDGFFRSLALCFQYCAPTHYHVLGICWASCDPGYTDHGASCFESLFNWYFKNSYIPHSVTNFDESVPCSTGNYKFGALCYRDCANIGMYNCGIGACVNDPSSCGPEIISMAIDTIVGIATAVASIFTGGAAGAAINGVKTGLKKVGISAIKKSLASLKKMFTSEMKKKIINRAKKYVKEKAIEIAQGKIQEFAVGKICDAIWDSAEQKTLSAPDVSEQDALDAVDIFNVQGIISGCSDTSTQNGAVDCAKNVIDGLSTFDPTGLLSVVATFMKPVCSVPGGEELEVPLATHEDLIINPNCIYLFEACFYLGDYREICDDAFGLEHFDKKTSSYKLGKAVSGMFYPEFGFSGKGFPFGPGVEVECLKDFQTEEVAFDDWIVSIKFHISHCFVITFQTPFSQYDDNFHYCETAPSVTLYLYNYAKFMRGYNFTEGVKLTLYSEHDFLGTSWEVPIGNIEPATIPIVVIKSYKLDFPADSKDVTEPIPEQPPKPIEDENIIQETVIPDRGVIEFVPLTDDDLTPIEEIPAPAIQ